MEISELEVAKEEVLKELAELDEAIAKGFINRDNRIVKDLRKVYGHLKYNGKVIDIFLAFKEAGLTENTDPRLAIVRADGNTCFLYKKTNGGALFSSENKSWGRIYPVKSKGDVLLPAGTFAWGDLEPEDRHRRTPKPMIPPRVSLAVSCRIIPQHYHIIFEVESWEPIAPKDPILVKRLTENLFGVMATWKLTELEGKIVQARMGRG